MRSMPTHKAALLYFLNVFGAGFLLGPIRIFLLVPKIGVRAAELIEMPIMLTPSISPPGTQTKNSPSLQTAA